MYANPKAWFLLMDKLGDVTISYVKAQIKAGAQAIQLFDSWVGALSREDYVTYIKPVMERVFNSLRSENVPLIMHGVGASHLATEWNSLPLDVVGLDWRLSVNEARALGVTKTVQGNLDPAILLAPWEVIEEKAKAILDQGMKSNHFIFNLGHGVFPEVDPAVLRRLTAFVHEYSAQYKQTHTS